MVLGVDPGAKSTGLVLVECFGGRPESMVFQHTVERVAGGVLLPPPATYIDAVLACIEAAMELHPVDLVGVEGVTRPSWHMGGRAAANPEALIATAWMGGVVQGAYPHLVRIVTPSGNGGGPLGSYPVALVSAREQSRANWQSSVGGAKAKLRHVRSAYDVARVAAQMWKVT